MLLCPTGIEITFSNNDYNANEGDGQIQVTLQTRRQRATPVTVRVTPINYDDFLSLGLPLPNDFPTVSDLVVNSPNRANTGNLVMIFNALK